MKKGLIITTIIFIAALSLIACSNDTEQPDEVDKEDMNQAEEAQEYTEENDLEKEENQSEITSEPEESDSEQSDSSKTTSKENHSSEKTNELSDFSSEEIEYARVWLQFGANQDMENLHVKHIGAGTSLNPDDDTSIDYPEDVIQLSGDRLVDGVVTYSGNGDGTINDYKIPKRWDGKNPAGKETYKEIIDNTKQMYIHPGDDEKVKSLIKILEIEQ